MTPFEDVLAHLIWAFAEPSVPASAWARMDVTSVDLDVPLETRPSADGGLLASLPRGVMATGFEAPLARLRVRCREVAP